MTEEQTKRVGRYRLLGRLGRGGMGEVHRARAYGAEGVSKDLCIKRIRAERLARPGAAARFVSEARLSIGLQHGNIVAVFDFGRSDDGYYLAMEWVDGVDLATLRRGGVLGPEVAAHVVAEIARALAYAHGREPPVVHRDVKPANVLVSRAGDVKLADFGLAVAERVGAGERAGTPGYMAPEQREGVEANPSADLFSLGVVLAELASEGRRAEEIDEPELREIAASLTAARPDARPASAAMAANRLEAFVARARAGGGRSPRESLAEAVRVIGRPEGGASAVEELQPTASYLRDGGDALLESLSRVSTLVPVPAKPTQGHARRWVAALVALAIMGAVGVGFGLASSEAHPGDPVTASPVASFERAAAAETAEDPQASPERAPGGGAPAESVSPGRATREQTSASTPSVVLPPRQEPPRAPMRIAVTPPARPRVPPTQVERSPQPEPALVSLNAIPWGEVEVDGRPLGATPLFDVPLSPGAHRVRFANAPLGASLERTVDVRAGERRRLVVDLRVADDTAQR
ncbi:MAG: protein kinase [Sandaracinaceae bacterium]